MADNSQPSSEVRQPGYLFTDAQVASVEDLILEVVGDADFSEFEVTHELGRIVGETRGRLGKVPDPEELRRESLQALAEATTLALRVGVSTGTSPLFILTPSEVRLLTGDTSACDDPAEAMKGVLALDARMRFFLAAQPTQGEVDEEV